MGYEVNKDIGPHDVDVESNSVYVKDGSDIVIHVRFKFSDGEIGDKDLYPTKSEKSLQIARKSLKIMGFDIDKRLVDELQDNPKLLAGQKVRVVVEEHEYNGNVTNRIAWINDIPKPASKAALKALTERLRNCKNDNASEAL